MPRTSSGRRRLRTRKSGSGVQSSGTPSASEGRPAVPFRLAAAEGTSVSFENPAHDFPQRIRYERSGDTLTATLSKLDGSEPQVFTFRRR